MKNIILTIYCTTFVCIALMGQTNTGYVPESIRLGLNLSIVPKFSLAPIDRAKLDKEDEADTNLGIPSRFAVENEVQINPANSGVWKVLPNGDKLWLLVISGDGARSIHLYYDKFHLPQGTKLSLYDATKKQILGPFTSKDNRGTIDNPGDFITGLIFNHTVIIEYYQPARVHELPIISISKAMYGYRGMSVQLEELSYKGGFGQSCADEVNVGCAPAGTPYQNVKTGIAMMIVGTSRQCTGTLINNIRADGKPYFLTADHCLTFMDAAGVTTTWDAVNNPSMPNWLFYWNYESNSSTPCTANGTDFVPPYSTGATVKANGPLPSATDFALLELTQSPYQLTPPVNAYFNGWDNTTGVPNANGIIFGPTSGTSIGHPMGDIKKITLYDVSSYPIFAASTSPNGVSFWQTSCGRGTNSTGTIEHGSSGSPLLNQNKHVVGQLWGFGSSQIGCANGTGIDAVFGRLDVSWNNGTLPTDRLKDWLDPGNTGATTLDGGTLQSCKPINATISSPTTTATTIDAGNSITSSSNITNGTSVRYYAGDNIKLTNGFNSGHDFIAKIQPCYSVSFKRSDAEITTPTIPIFSSIRIQKVTVSPNPVADNFTIHIATPILQNCTLSLFDLNGRLLETYWRDKAMPTGETDEQLKVNNSLSDGVYILKFVGSNYTESIRLIKSSN